MAVWSGLVPAPASASQTVDPSLATAAAVHDAGWDQPDTPPLDGPGQDEPRPNASAGLYLPDLRTLPLFDLHIRVLPGGQRSLRLANTIWNSGQGPLELTGEFNAVTNRTRVVQHIHTADGGWREVLVGEFVWHPTHDHWHFDEFTLYELWTLKADHSLDQVVASSDKLSYCVIDSDVVDRELPGFSPRRSYANCGQRQQGLSVGWGDTYKSFLDGQSLDLTGLPDGFYALTSRVNPNGVIRETDYTNNSTRAYLALLGDQLIVVSLNQVRVAECAPTLCE
jgi:hypothetical protein